MPKRVRQRRSDKVTAFSSMNYRHPIFLLQNHCSPGVVAQNIASILPGQLYQQFLSQPSGFTYLAQTFSYPVQTARCDVIPSYGDPNEFPKPVAYRRNGFPAYGLMYQLRLPIYQHIGNMETQLKRFCFMKPLYFWYRFKRDASTLDSTNPYTIVVSNKQNCLGIINYEALIGQPHRTYKLRSGGSVTIRVPILVNKSGSTLVNSLTMDNVVGLPVTDGSPNPSTAAPWPALNRRAYPLAGGLTRHPWMPTAIFTKWVNDMGFGVDAPQFASDPQLTIRAAYFKYMLHQMQYSGPVVAITSQVDAHSDAYQNPSAASIIYVSPFPGNASENLAPQNGRDIEVSIGCRVAFSTPIKKPFSVSELEGTIVLPRVRQPSPPLTEPYEVFGPSALFCGSGVRQVPFDYDPYRDEASAFVNNVVPLVDPDPNLQILPTLLPTNQAAFSVSISRDRGPFSLTSLAPPPTNPNPNSVLWNQEPVPGTINPVQAPYYDRQDNAEVFQEEPRAFEQINNYRDL